MSNGVGDSIVLNKKKKWDDMAVRSNGELRTKYESVRGTLKIQH
jgi:hypothetical protein